jgi:hypothetical protein
MIVIRRAAQGKHKRGSHWQQDKRAMERSIRIQGLIFLRWAVPIGMTQAAAARKMGLRPDTLARWKAGWARDRLRVDPRGRPVDRERAARRNEVLAALALYGPGSSVQCLMKEFPYMARREIEDLVSRYRRFYRKKGVLIHTLRWTRPGAVWAMDFAEPTRPVDNIFNYVFAVRDLASGYMLKSQPVAGKDAKGVYDALAALFLQWGPPLVIKCDNELGFIAKLLMNLFDLHGVLLLLSPVDTPRYNGAIEAGIGSLKTHAEFEAARHDRPGEWTCDDIEAARLMANETAHPQGLDGCTPDPAWAQRIPITPAEREAFLERYFREASDEFLARGYIPDDELFPAARAAIDRKAIARACVAQGLLCFRRRRFSLLIKSYFSGKISS